MVNLISELFRSNAVCCEHCGRPLPHDEVRCAREVARRMSRRHFFGIGIGAAAAVVLPAPSVSDRLAEIQVRAFERLIANHRYLDIVSERDYRVPFYSVG
jgi:hypothetical protein